MKNGRLRAAGFLLGCITSLFVTAGWGADPAAGIFVPEIPIEEALGMALRHVTAEKIDTTGQYVRGITLQYERGSTPGRYYWLVQWAWAQPRLGGEMGVMVYMDGTVVIRNLGP